MGLKEKKVREKILLAAITCIEREGINHVTTREIAKEADVNVAAINYYFGTKEKLLDKALKHTKDHFFSDLEAILKKQSKDPYLILKTFVTYSLEGSLRYPYVTQAHLYSAQRRSAFAKSFNDFLTQLVNKIKPLVPKRKRKDIKKSIIQMVSAIMFISFFPDFFCEFSGFSIRDVKVRKRYIKHLLKHYFRA